MRGGPVDPRIQTFQINFTLTGPIQAQADALVQAFQQRCPVYTTLERAAPIEISTNVITP